MKLQRATVIEAADKRLVEMLFADQPEPDEHEAQIRFVVPVPAEGYPPIAKAHLEALLLVRNAIDGEIQRLQHVPGPAD